MKTRKSKAPPSMRKKHRKAKKGMPKIFVINLRRDLEKWDKYHNDEYGDLIVCAETATDSHKKNFNLTPLKWNPKYKEPNWITNI